MHNQACIEQYAQWDATSSLSHRASHAVCRTATAAAGFCQTLPAYGACLAALHCNLLHVLSLTYGHLHCAACLIPHACRCCSTCTQRVWMHQRCRESCRTSHTLQAWNSSSSTWRSVQRTASSCQTATRSSSSGSCKTGATAACSGWCIARTAVCCRT